MEKKINLESNLDRLFFYSPYRIVRGLDPLKLTYDTVVKPIQDELNDGKAHEIIIEIKGYKHFVIIKELEWDSQNLGFKCIKIVNVLFDHSNIDILIKAVALFIERNIKLSKAYYFLDLPSEDLLLTQAFTNNGFRLVESRLNYYYQNISNYSCSERYPVRFANKKDAIDLKSIAIKMRNPYDRLHADLKIDNSLADKYIGVFANNSALGFADYVLVPETNNEPPFGFLAFNKPISYSEVNISKLVLAAIDNTNHKGWLLKLLSEAVIFLKENDVEFLTTITQTSNIAAFRTWEKFGFKLGFNSNILVYIND